MLDYDFENSVEFWLFSTAQEISRVMNEDLAAHGITSRQWAILALITHFGELSQRELAERMSVESADDRCFGGPNGTGRVDPASAGRGRPPQVADSSDTAESDHCGQRWFDAQDRVHARAAGSCRFADYSIGRSSGEDPGRTCAG